MGRVWSLKRVTVMEGVSGEDTETLGRAGLVLGPWEEWKLLGRTGDKALRNLVRNVSVSQRKEGLGQ